ncbi:hypothetical protein [Paraglaciecola sp.]|uniref:hypothetical protein n=1 Tax=Paraglaciecola sp. TaxID=1920173 RepID=UPI003EF1F92C
MNQFKVNQEIENTFGKFNEAYKILEILKRSVNDVFIDSLVIGASPNAYDLLKELNSKIYKNVPISNVFYAYKKLLKFDQDLIDYVHDLDKLENAERFPSNYVQALYGVTELTRLSVLLMEEAINYQDDKAA